MYYDAYCGVAINCAEQSVYTHSLVYSQSSVDLFQKIRFPVLYFCVSFASDRISALLCRSRTLWPLETLCIVAFPDSDPGIRNFLYSPMMYHNSQPIAHEHTYVMIRENQRTTLHDTLPAYSTNHWPATASTPWPSIPRFQATSPLSRTRQKQYGFRLPQVPHALCAALASRCALASTVSALTLQHAGEGGASSICERGRPSPPTHARRLLPSRHEKPGRN